MILSEPLNGKEVEDLHTAFHELEAEGPAQQALYRSLRERDTLTREVELWRKRAELVGPALMQIEDLQAVVERLRDERDVFILERNEALNEAERLRALNAEQKQALTRHGCLSVKCQTCREKEAEVERLRKRPTEQMYDQLLMQYGEATQDLNDRNAEVERLQDKLDRLEGARYD